MAEPVFVLTHIASGQKIETKNVVEAASIIRIPLMAMTLSRIEHGDWVMERKFV